jgi:NAD(P)-dependent dehydrogenase (short-subunit alcohol dehydrogenase family)
MNKKTVLITGASSGIGKETAKTLLSKGYTVYAAARRVEKMADLMKLGAVPVSMDVTKDEDMVAVVEQIKREHGGVDILINNAGFGKFGSIEDTPSEIARSQYEVNVFGLARLIQLVLPYMREQRAGKIINVSSVGGRMAQAFGGWYQSTKHAVEGMSDALRMEVQRFGIDVIVIEPGIIASEWDSIAADGLLEISGNGSYKDAAHKIAQSIKNNYKNASPASGVANTISKAISADRPKTRYLTGNSAHMVIFLKWLLPDRLFDRLMMAMTGI